MKSDNYFTIRKRSHGIFKDKGSRFLSFAYPLSDPGKVKPLLDELRREHHEAKHHCYAYMIGYERNLWRANDDGEPSGTAGKPILGQINSFDLTNVLIVVIRYFGGTLLGVSGLINAYRSAAGMAIKNAGIIKCYVQELYEITFPYKSMNDVMKVLKEDNVGQSDQKFDLECSIIINFRSSADERILERLERIVGLEYRHIKTY
jgi:uncharacterized YigZ family protein